MALATLRAPLSVGSTSTCKGPWHDCQQHVLPCLGHYIYHTYGEKVNCVAVSKIHNGGASPVLVLQLAVVMYQEQHRLPDAIGKDMM